ncbi:MAG TPA: glucose-6-phosphate isomerase [bacterium]|nr:glucose-6-phosphate isomerase [bacterium]
MSQPLTLDLTYIHGVVPGKDLEAARPKAEAALKTLLDHHGRGSDFLGWIGLPFEVEKQLPALLKTAGELAGLDAVICIGIGGSYLGARATIEALGKGKPEIHYLGNHLHATYYADLMDKLEGKQVGLYVISKSGTTTEPAVAFRLLKPWVEKAAGKAGAKRRIVAITDQAKGALKTLADAEGYATFVIPDDVGGRYSVLTPVGLLPIASAGVDIAQLLKGAQAASKDCASGWDTNPALRYAAARQCLYAKGKTIEVLANFRPDFHYISEWWKQLYGESEGKEGKGAFPASVDLTTDLHSMGQYLQEGRRDLYETILWVAKEERDLAVPSDPDDRDGLNFLAGKPLSWVNEQAMKGTAVAHQDGGLPVIRVTMEKLDAFSLGYLYYFFEMACGVSGTMLGINPFDQPGVEAYKKNMFALLGKKGFEPLLAELRKKGVQ